VPIPDFLKLDTSATQVTNQLADDRVDGFPARKQLDKASVSRIGDVFEGVSVGLSDDVLNDFLFHVRRLAYDGRKVNRFLLKKDNTTYCSSLKFKPLHRGGGMPIFEKITKIQFKKPSRVVVFSLPKPPKPKQTKIKKSKTKNIIPYTVSPPPKISPV